MCVTKKDKLDYLYELLEAELHKGEDSAGDILVKVLREYAYIIHNKTLPLSGKERLTIGKYQLHVHNDKQIWVFNSEKDEGRLIQKSEFDDFISQYI